MTPAQNAIIKADIAANSDLNVFPNNSDGSYAIAELYNLPAVPPFSVWKTNVSVSSIYDGINWSLYTPTDSPEASGMYTARAQAIQIKQMNLQNMLQGRETVDCSKANIRSGLRDAVIQIPSGTSGANTNPGGSSGVNVLSNCVRNATRLEKLLSTGPATTGSVTANILGFEGAVTPHDIDLARA